MFIHHLHCQPEYYIVTNKAYLLFCQKDKEQKGKPCVKNIIVRSPSPDLNRGLSGSKTYDFYVFVSACFAYQDVVGTKRTH